MNAAIVLLNLCGSRFVHWAGPMLLQSSVLIALLFAWDMVLRKWIRATVRYALWMLVLIKLVLPPSLALPTSAAYWMPAKGATSISSMSYALEAPLTVAADKANLIPQASPAPPNAAKTSGAMARLRLTWQADLFILWAVVASCLFLWTLWRWRSVALIVNQSGEPPESVQMQLEACRRQLHLRGRVPVRCSVFGAPAVWGVLRPVILIPSNLASELSEPEMRAVLLHELAHYKRGDLWINLLQILLQIPYWFHPLVWMANARLRAAREEAVDEMALLESGSAAESYSMTLLRVARLGLSNPPASSVLVGILQPGRLLTQRVKHIMERPLPFSARLGLPGLAAVLLLAALALPMAGKTDSEILQQTLPDGSVLLVKKVAFGKDQTSPVTGQTFSSSFDLLQVDFLLTTTAGAVGGRVDPNFFLRLRTQKSPFVSSSNFRQLRCLLRGDGIEYAEELRPWEFAEKNDGFHGYLLTSIFPRDSRWLSMRIEACPSKDPPRVWTPLAEFKVANPAHPAGHHWTAAPIPITNEAAGFKLVLDDLTVGLQAYSPKDIWNHHVALNTRVYDQNVQLTNWGPAFTSVEDASGNYASVLQSNHSLDPSYVWKIDADFEPVTNFPPGMVATVELPEEVSTIISNMLPAELAAPPQRPSGPSTISLKLMGVPVTITWQNGSMPSIIDASIPTTNPAVALKLIEIQDRDHDVLRSSASSWDQYRFHQVGQFLAESRRDHIWSPAEPARITFAVVPNLRTTFFAQPRLIVPATADEKN